MYSESKRYEYIRISRIKDNLYIALCHWKVTKRSIYGLYSSNITMKGGTHPMSYTHRGLSDVVTTVLIILLVVVAVVAIGAYVRTSVDQSGRTVEREGTCLSNSISVASCKYTLVSGNSGTTGVYNLTLNTKRMSDDVAITGTPTAQVAVKSSTGTLQTVTVIGSAPTTNGALSTMFTGSLAAGLPAEVTLLTEFTLKSGNKVICSSTPVPCAL